MSVSKTADAARKAVEKSQSKGKVERTPEEVIEQIRRNFAANLAVTPDDQKFLLTQYDAAAAQESLRTGLLSIANDAVTKLQHQVVDLTAKNEELRAVYEQENRSATLRVDVLAVKDQIENGPSDAALLVPVGSTDDIGSEDAGCSGREGVV